MTRDPKTRALGNLARAHTARLAAAQAEIAAVAAAREAGATWDEIAALTGVRTKQQAQRKFSPLLEERVTRTVTVRDQPA